MAADNLELLTTKVDRAAKMQFEEWCASKGMTPYEAMQYFVYMADMVLAYQKGLTHELNAEIEDFFNTFGWFGSNEEIMERLRSFRAARSHKGSQQSESSISSVIMVRKGGTVETLDPNDTSMSEMGTIVSGPDAAISSLLSVGGKLPTIIRKVMQYHKTKSIYHLLWKLIREEAQYIGYEESQLDAQSYAQNEYGTVPKQVRNRSMMP